MQAAAFSNNALASLSAATPGRTLPSRSSSEAPPPVEMCDIFSARPAFSTAATESPPPMMVMQPFLLVISARVSAMSKVPLAVPDDGLALLDLGLDHLGRLGS